MIKFYVSLRPIQLDERLFYPNAHLDQAFKGLDIQYLLIAFNSDLDGRMLFEIQIGANSSYSDQELIDYKAIFMEGMSSFGIHEKTSLQAAVDLANKITGCSFIIDGDHIRNPKLPEA